MLPTRLKKGDRTVLALVAVVLALTGGITLGARIISGGTPVAQIIIDGQVVDEIPLRGATTEERTYATGYGTNTVRIEDGRIRFSAADCHDEVCVATGWLTRPGQSAVCVPNRIAIVVRGSGTEVDAVVR